MDLFVINRYNEEAENNVTDEKTKLDKILKKINKRKLAREKRKLNLKPNFEVKHKEITSNNKNVIKTNEIELKTDKSEVLNVKEQNETIQETHFEEDSDDNEPRPKKQKLDPADIEGFTILGDNKFDKKKTVKRILPKWLRNPTVISSDLNNLKIKVSKTNLNDTLKKKLKDKDIKYLFPVQAAFIPWELNSAKNSYLLPPPDACVSAPTGSGKTLAFTIPILHHLMEQLEKGCLTVKAIRALIVLPTQSLALQIYDTIASLCIDTGIKVGLATGAGAKSLENEVRQLICYNSIWGASSKVDILVCTPGRLVDHLKSTTGFDLTHLQFVVIDEADRVLDLIQDDWLYHLGIHLQSDNAKFLSRSILNVDSIKKRTDPQKLLFSATLSQDPEKLQKLSLFQPKLFTCVTNEDERSINDDERFIGKYTMPSELTEKYVTCTIETKPLILYKLIMDEITKCAKSRILVFVNTIQILHRLQLLLDCMSQGNFSVSEISSNRGNLDARKALLKKFEEGELQVLVCTDSMARGIDIPNVDCVISYSVPAHLKTYIHRAGRTARAGSNGFCVAMLHPKQQTSFLQMIENVRSKSKTIEKIDVSNEDLEELTPLYEESLEKLKDIVKDEVKKSALNVKHKKKINMKKRIHKAKKKRVQK